MSCWNLIEAYCFSAAQKERKAANMATNVEPRPKMFAAPLSDPADVTRGTKALVFIAAIPRSVSSIRTFI